MPVQISYLKKSIKKTSCSLVLFTDDKFNLSSLKKNFSESEYSYINDLLKISDIKKKILIFDVNSKKKIVLVSIKNNLKTCDIENLGAEFYKSVKQYKKTSITLTQTV